VAVLNVAVVNAGSSSLKLRLLDEADAVVRSCDLERWAGEDETDELRGFLGEGADIDAVAHRVVHGGLDFTGPVVLDDGVVARLAALTDLAPLHQPRDLAGIAAVRAIAPGLPAVACFDTAFHATMPAAASTYAVPESWRTDWPVRRFGFHGLSHAYAARAGAEAAGLDVAASRIVTCHLGAGASLCAVHNGRSVDTTMGFTPLEGLVMATRSGSVDPGLVLWLVQQQGLDPAEVNRALESESGLKGLSGGSGDMRDVLAAAAADDDRARLALDVYVHRLAGSIAQMAAAMGGVDLVVFTGGVGEHAAAIRQQAVERLAFIGDLKTAVVEAREDVEMARQAREVLAAAAR